MHFEWNGSRPWLEEAAKAQKAARVQAGATPGMTPGNFDVNAIMKPDPAASPNVVNYGGASNRAVHQTFHNTTTITGADRPREAARIMESAFGNMHSLALQNAQSATV